ncbi:hypothetical protein, partial [Leptospira sp. Pond_2020]|uniref:hypothetical protein n=1 Tax=Leptospira sp. Pond_2020 TaxID=2846916 RepID=UPI001E3BA63A
ITSSRLIQDQVEILIFFTFKELLKEEVIEDSVQFILENIQESEYIAVFTTNSESSNFSKIDSKIFLNSNDFVK